VDVTRANIDCVMQCLAFHNYDWQIEIDSVTAIYEPAGTIGEIRYTYAFAT
jgi:hypothetical protein